MSEPTGKIFKNKINGRVIIMKAIISIIFLLAAVTTIEAQVTNLIKMKKIIIVLSLFLIFSNAYSNNSDSISSPKSAEITDTTHKCTVITNSRNKYSGVHIFGLSDSSVKIFAGNFSGEILIQDIKSIKFNGRGFWKGALIGGGAALLAGFNFWTFD